MRRDTGGAPRTSPSAGAVVGLPPPPAFECPTFEQLYASARRWLPAELRRLGVLDADVEDVLHDVVLIAHQGLGHFDPTARSFEADDAAALRAWIRGIAWRQVAKRQKKASCDAALLRAIGTDTAWGIHQMPSAEHVAATGERRRMLLGVLAKIQPRRAEVLVLHELLDMTAPEIARQLGVNENTVKSRINRARCDALRAIERLPAEHRSALQDLGEPQGAE